MTTVQTSMHQGQRVPSRKMLTLISQITKPSAPSIPALKSSQNHRENRAPARMQVPTAIGAGKPIRPSSGFGKPNTEPSGEDRLRPHCTSTLKLQFGTKFG